jgi:ribosome-associated protein
MFPNEEILKQISYRTSRSSGSGGQNVNKVETKVEAFVTVDSLECFTEVQRTTIHAKCANRINSLGELAVTCSEKRSQLQNKKLATEKLLTLLENALKPVRKRKPTTVPRAVDRKRLELKKENSEKKQRRGFKP